MIQNTEDFLSSNVKFDKNQNSDDNIKERKNERDVVEDKEIANSEYSKTTRDMESHKQLRLTEDSNKTNQSINVEKSEFGKSTPLSPSKTNSKNPSMIQNLETNNDESKSHFYNYNSIQENSSNKFNKEFSSLHEMNNPNKIQADINSKLIFKKENNDAYKPINTINKNLTELPKKDYFYSANNVEYTNYSIPQIPPSQIYYPNYNSYEKTSLPTSNYNQSSSFIKFNSETIPKKNEVVITTLPATTYQKIPTTPATSGVLSSYIPQYFESAYIKPNYNNFYYPSSSDIYSLSNNSNFNQVNKEPYSDKHNYNSNLEGNSSNSLSNLIKFDKFPGEYFCQAIGKYTKNLGEIIKSLRINEKLEIEKEKKLHFSYEPDNSNVCVTHHEIEEYILFENVDEFKIYDKICKNCLSMLRMRKGKNKIDARLYYEVILDNKEILNAIRLNRIDFDLLLESNKIFKETNKLLKENIMSLADEIIHNCETFEKEINCNLENIFENEELIKVKEFINSLEFDIDGNPNLSTKGSEKNTLIYKFLSLATFLINMSYNNTSVFCFKEKQINMDLNLTEKLKNYIINFSKFRKYLVLKLNSFIKFLVNNYFGFISNLEGKALDNEFQNSVQINYINDEELSNIKLVYDSEINKRDNEIKALEEDNIRMKHELEIMRTNFSHFSEQEIFIQKLKQDISKLEEDRNSQNIAMKNSLFENERLNKLNLELSNNLEMIKNDINHLKIDFEAKFRSAIDQIKSEYESKIITIGSELNDTRFKLAEVETKYTVDIRNLIQERDGLKNQIINLQQRYEMDIKALKEQLDAFLRDYNNIQKNLNNHVIQITSLNQEKDTMRILIESYKAQISNFENTIQNQSNQISSLLRERDDLRNNLGLFKTESDKLRNELNGQINARTGLETILIESRKKGDELINALNTVKTEFTNKLTIIPQLEAQIRELSKTNGQMNNQINSYLSTLQRFDNENKELKRIIDEMKIKLYQSAEKDNEINNLNQTISCCRQEFTRLSEDYESLVNDIKNQLSINEGLRAFINELQMKIENHNNQIINNDLAIRQQIENLAKHSLQKKVIDYNPNNDAIWKSQNEIESVKNKIGRIESQKLSRSQIFFNQNYPSFGQNQGYKQDPQLHYFIGQSIPTSNPGFNLNSYQQNYSQEYNQSVNAPRKSSSESIIREIEALTTKEKISSNECETNIKENQ